MDDQMNSDFTPGLDEATGECANGGMNLNAQATALKDKASQQATVLKEKLSEQVRTYGGQMREKADVARGKASVGLRTTSERFRNWANYLESHDANDMSDAVVETSREMIRKHPGKSLLVAAGIGLLIGRVFFGMGAERR